MLTKRPLKIFVDGYLLNKEYQGTKTYLKELYKEFSVKNKDISIFIGCFEDAEIIKEFESYTNINWIFYKSTNRFIRMFFELPKLIKEHNFHYAHFQYLIPFVRNKSTKYITTIHDIIFNDYKDQFSFSYRIVRNFLFKYSARKTDLLLTVSDYSKERIKNVYKIDNKPIYVVANAVSKDYFEPYDKNVSKDYISNKYGIGRFVLYVSRIEPRKNHHKLLKIFFDLKLEDIALVLIGNSSINNAEFSKYVNELTDDQKKLFFHLKNIDEEDLKEFYRACDIFVYPSLAEGFGIPPLEAAATKSNVICSKSTAMKEFDFFSPYHLDPTNDEQLGKALKDLNIQTRNEDRLIKISELVKNNYSWESSAKKMSQIIMSFENK